MRRPPRSTRDAIHAGTPGEPTLCAVGDTDGDGVQPVTIAAWAPQGEQGAAPARPLWLRKRIRTGARAERVQTLLDGLTVRTVCRHAHCPNLYECFSTGTATFLLLGDRCTRACRFCAVASGAPLSPDRREPKAVADVCAMLGLRHVVLTSVTRDDLADGGAGHFCATARAIRNRVPEAAIEMLVPDLGGREKAVALLLRARPDILAHNVETVPRLYSAVRPDASYARSLQVLAYAKQSSIHRPAVRTKSGLMVGLGETSQEVLQVMADLRAVGCDLLTIGQYLAPSARHLPIARFVPPDEFQEYVVAGKEMGFAGVAAGPLVRSSYRAADLAGSKESLAHGPVGG